MARRINPTDIIGKVYNYLYIDSYIHYGYNPEKENSSKQKDHYYKCICKCGNIKIIRRTNILKYDVKSCGCALKDYQVRQSIINRNINGPSQYSYLYNQAKNNAKYRGYEFSLSKEEHRKLLSDKCFYCGKIGSNYCKIKSRYGDLYYNGIDRVDNTKGYILENCVTCCNICNKAKHTLTQEEFFEWIKRIIVYNKDTGEI